MNIFTYIYQTAGFLFRIRTILVLKPRAYCWCKCCHAGLRLSFWIHGEKAVNVKHLLMNKRWGRGL